MQTIQGDPAGLAALTRGRHNEDEANSATLQAEEETRRLNRRRRDEREKNRVLWTSHYRTVAATLRRRAETLERRAAMLDPTGKVVG